MFRCITRDTLSPLKAKKNHSSRAGQSGAADSFAVPTAKPDARRRRRLWFRVVALLVPVLVLVLVELLLRALGVGYPTAFFLKTEVNGRAMFIDGQSGLVLDAKAISSGAMMLPEWAGSSKAAGRALADLPDVNYMFLRTDDVSRLNALPNGTRQRVVAQTEGGSQRVRVTDPTEPVILTEATRPPHSPRPLRASTVRLTNVPMSGYLAAIALPVRDVDQL